MSLTRLQEKQQYYLFGENGYSFKEPPQLPAELIRQMDELGTDPDTGKPLWRYTWGGVAVYRDDPDQEPPAAIRGPVESTTVVRGRIVPRYLHVNAKALVWICYKIRRGKKKGKVVRVKRPEHVPTGHLSWAEYEYVMFGKLYWYLERYLTAEQLVEGNAYFPDDVPPQGDYFCVSDGPICTEEGLYYEPDEDAVELLRQHLQEEQNERHSDLMLERAVRRQQQEFKQKLRSIEEMAGLVEDALSAPLPTASKQFGPPREQPPFQPPGDIIVV